MAKVLSLMATHTGDKSQYNRSVAEIDDYLTIMKKIRSTQIHSTKGADPQEYHR